METMAQRSSTCKFCNLTIGQLRVPDDLLRKMAESTRKVSRRLQEGQSLPQALILFLSEISSLKIEEATLNRPRVPEWKKQLYRNTQGIIC
jgi:hypothetical protein